MNNVAIDKQLKQRLINIRVFRGADVESEHILAKAKVQVKLKTIEYT